MTTIEVCLPDISLVERAKTGDHEAFTELVRRHEGRVYQLALRLTGNTMDAMDVIQDVFLSVYQKIHTFRGTAAFSSWLYRIAANASFARLNQRRRAAAVSLEESLPAAEARLTDLHAGRSLTPDMVLFDKETLEILESAINNLPDKFRKVVQFRDVQDLSNQEVAEMLNLSIPAIKSRLHRARVALRMRLGDYFESHRLPRKPFHGWEPEQVLRTRVQPRASGSTWHALSRNTALFKHVGGGTRAVPAKRPPTVPIPPR